MSIMDFLFSSWDEKNDTGQVIQEGLHLTRSFRARHSHVLGGIVAGWCAGIIMALFEAGISLAHGYSALTPFYLIDVIFRGFIFFVVGKVGTVVIGFLIHMLLSGFFGGVFALLLKVYADEKSVADCFFAGLAYSVLIWAVTMYGFVLRWSSISIDEKLGYRPEEWFFVHLVFGASLFLTPILSRAILGRRGKEKLDQLPEKSLAA